MEDTMFRDEDDLVKAEVTALLEVYDLDDILFYNEMDVAEAVTHLIMDGHITLPEVKPL